jgi:O-acetyl-ADP-ribose deacetylase (regulator of RNase III)
MTTFSEETGNLLKADVDALVNTVNTVGVMGKGLALQFKNAFPENYKAYRRACEQETVRLGEMFVFETGALGRPRLIINFPTKQHWRARSRLRDIKSGLDALGPTIREYQIRSIAVPPLGCGNGGLDWADVLPSILTRLDELDAEVQIYPPGGAPAAGDMVVATERPVLTPGKAALVLMVDRYAAVALSISLIEIQKLMYFMQESGEDLRLRYSDHYFGPYADNLRHVLKALEGHHLYGYGDGANPIAHAEPIVVLPGATEEARSVLAEHPDIAIRMSRVLKLVEGYESPFGLELLATVHWVAKEIDWDPDDGQQQIVERVQAWSRRKKQLFNPEHITTACERLRQDGWLNPIASADCVYAGMNAAEMRLEEFEA